MESLARSSVQLTDTAGKRLEILREVVPGLRRLATSGNFPNPTVAPELQAVQAAAHALGLDIISSEFRRAEEIAPAIEKVTCRVEALYVCADPLVHTNAVRLNGLALAARLPVMHSFRENVEAGGLVSYGRTVPTCIGAPPIWSTRFYAEPSPLISRSSNRRSSDSS